MQIAKGKTRFVSVLLAFLLVFTMCPITAYADELPADPVEQEAGAAEGTEPADEQGSAPEASQESAPAGEGEGSAADGQEGSSQGQAGVEGDGASGALQEEGATSQQDTSTQAGSALPSGVQPATTAETDGGTTDDSAAEIDEKKLDSLVVFYGSSNPTNSAAVVLVEGVGYESSLHETKFSADVYKYSVSVPAGTDKVYFRGQNASGESVTADFTAPGGNQSGKTLKKNASITVKLVPGVNSIRVKVDGVEYLFEVSRADNLASLSVSTDAGSAYLSEGIDSAPVAFDGSIRLWVLGIPEDATTATIAATMPSAGSTVEGIGGLSLSDSQSITVTAVSLDSASGSTPAKVPYSLFIKRVPWSNFGINVEQDGAEVRVFDPYGVEIVAEADGSYKGLFSLGGYTYSVSKAGYTTKTGPIDPFAGTASIDVALQDADYDWPNFRGSDNNMAIVDIETPIDITSTYLKWSMQFGEGVYKNPPGALIIVDGSLIVTVNATIYKLDLQTGEILAQEDMLDAPKYAVTPPTYAEGMIFVALQNGTIQAFDADTLKSLWVYKDDKGGQGVSPITYSNGYIYTGFWSSDTGEASYVCLSVTDEDPSKPDEEKTNIWSKSQTGGFYWAGSVVVGDYVIYGSDNGIKDTSAVDPSGAATLYSVKAATGEVVSSINLVGMGDQRSSIAYDASSGKVYFTTSGGYLCSARIDSVTGVLSDFQSQAGAFKKATSTPVVYKGRVYYGAGDKSSVGGLIVADADTLETLFTVPMKGYPQSSMLLSTAYEAETGYIYLYGTYNNPPGGISMVKVKPDCQTAADAELVELYDAAGYGQYCIASIICGPDGTLYYKNDSYYVFAVGYTADALVKKVVAKIDAIGEVTLDDEAAIEAARAAYDALSDSAQQAKVTNYSTLLAAEAALANLKAAAENPNGGSGTAEGGEAAGTPQPVKPGGVTVGGGGSFVTTAAAAEIDGSGEVVSVDWLADSTVQQPAEASVPWAWIIIGAVALIALGGLGGYRVALAKAKRPGDDA